MKKIMGIFILFALITPLFLQHIKAAEFSAVDVNITYQYDSENSSSSVLADKVYGSYVDFQPAVNPSYNFAVWVVNGVVRPDLPENASIKVTSNMNIIGLYAPVGEYGVLFIDTNGQIIDRQYVVSGGTAVPPTNALPNKPGLEIKADAWVSDQGLITFDNVLENRIYTLQYQSSSSDTYDLYIDNVLYSAYPYNELVTVTADASVEGVPFAFWSLNGYAVSSDLSYTFTMLEDMNLTKVYENGYESGPMLVMSNDLGIRAGYQSFMAQFYLPEGYELVEWGFIYSNDNTADLAIGNDGVVQAQSNQFNPASNEYLMSFSLGFLNAISAYMFYDDGSSVHVMYSEITNRYQASAAGYMTSFENSTKGSYAAAVIDIDGVSWNLNEAVIGNLAGEALTGSQALRIDDDPGFIQSQTYFDTINFISFSAKMYGADGDNQLFVYVSEDAVNWIDVSDSIPGGILATSEYLEYVIDLSISTNFINSGLSNSNLYVQILNPNDSGRRVNLDDLVVGADYTYSNVLRLAYVDDATTDYDLIIPGELVSQIDDPTREGYTFNGWYTDQSYTTLFDFENTYIDVDSYVFASWSIGQFTVSFDSNGGSAVASITDDYGTDISGFFEEPTKTGYNFTGWYSDSELTTLYTFDTIPGSDITIYAGWSPIEYSITYNLDGGLNHELNPATYTIEDEVNLLAASKDGYVFAGWYDAAVSGEEVTLITNQTGDVTLYAYWTVSSGTEYTVSFVTNGDAISNQTVAEGNYALEPTSPTYSGHWLDGYYVDAAFTTPFDFATEAINSNVSIYLKWQQNASDLFISEYIEGGGTNKAIEIYNGTGATIDLANYSLDLYSNGSSTVSATVPLSGLLANNEVYVIYNSTTPAIVSVGDLKNSTVINFNGDDVIVLNKNSVLIDIIGLIPQTTSFAADVTWVRNNNITSGNSVFTLAEWTAFAKDTYTYLGIHTYNPGE